MSRYVGKTNKEARFRRLDMQHTRNNLAGADRHGSHFFKVFRLTDDVCAKCGKPRAEHPRRGIT